MNDFSGPLAHPWYNDAHADSNLLPKIMLSKASRAPKKLGHGVVTLVTPPPPGATAHDLEKARTRVTVNVN